MHLPFPKLISSRSFLMIQSLNSPSRPTDLDSDPLTPRFAPLLTASSFLPWTLSLLVFLAFGFFFTVSHCSLIAVSPPTRSITDTGSSAPKQPFIELKSRRKRRRKLRDMDDEGIARLRAIEYRQLIATTRPSTELILAQSASVRRAVEELKLDFRHLVRQRLTTARAVRRVFPRSLNQVYGPSGLGMHRGEAMEVGETEDAGRDTPAPDAEGTNYGGILEREDDSIGRDKPMPSSSSWDIADVSKWNDGISSVPGSKADEDVQDTPTDSGPLEESKDTLAHETDTPLLLQRSNGGPTVDKPMASVPAENATADEERPATSYFPPQPLPTCQKDGNRSYRLEAHDHQKSRVNQTEPEPKKASATIPNADHPLPPLPSSPLTYSDKTVAPMDVEGLPQSCLDVIHALNSEGLIPAMSVPDTEPDNDNNLWPAPLSPTPSMSTLATNNNSDHGSPTGNQFWDDQTLVEQSQSMSPISHYMSGDSTESDSHDDYEPGDIVWEATENELERFCGRVERPEQVEITTHQLLEFDCRTWDWAGQFDRYIDFCLGVREEAWDNPQSRVYFPQAYHDAAKTAEDGSAIDTPLASAMPLPPSLEAIGKQRSCQGASVKKPARGPASLRNMVERRLLQFFKDNPEGAPITSSHMIRMWNMLEQTTQILNQHRNKIYGFTRQPKQTRRRVAFEERFDVVRWRFVDEDRTLLLRSKGMNSPLAEAISIDEEWPEGWKVTMTQLERYKIAGKNKRDPMKRLLESLSRSAEDD